MKTGIRWQGRIPGSDPRFESFVSLAYGIRALLVDLHTKITRRRFDTIRKILTAYAPPNENNTAAYINFVSNRTGFGPDQPLAANRDTISRLATAIVIKENGSGITPDELAAGWDLFPSKKKVGE